jgi:hypothetical protein
MLIDLMSDKPLTGTPHEADYNRWIVANMSQEEIDGVTAALNEYIDEGDKQVITAGWIPGKDWGPTPYQVLFEKAAARDWYRAAQCFGLMVWCTVRDRPETWATGKFEINGEPIGSRTYFRVNR